MTTKPARSRSAPPAPARGSSRAGTWWAVGIVLAVVALAAVIAVVATGGSDEGDDGASTASREVGEVRVSGPPLAAMPEGGPDPAVGMAAPRVEGEDFAGDAQAIPAAGTPTMIVFAAHWCPHCQREIPRIVSWAGSGLGEVDLVLVATGTSPDAPNYPPSQWLADEEWPGRVVVDDAEGSAAAAYGLSGYPLIVYVDAEGRVVRRLAGEQETSDLDSAVAELTAAGRPPAG